MGLPQFPVPFHIQDRLLTFFQFLHARRNEAGLPLSMMFGVPQQFPDQWFRLSWLPFLCASDETISLQEKWVRAWHGTKLEALYATAYHGCLLESSDENQGERYLTNGQGVYLHGDHLRYKTGCYSRFVQPIPDGISMQSIEK